MKLCCPRVLSQPLSATLDPFFKLPERSNIMPKVTVHDGYIWVGDQRIPHLQGEFHAWRNVRAYWPRIIRSIKDIGFKHIASYVEWDFHRITPNGTPLGEIKYDFTGETDQQRDLAGYLDIIDKDDTLWLTIRPGPYIYAETEFGGPPEEASDNHYHRLHPRFLDLADHYMRAVCKVIRPHLATNGGKIVLCQLDNEVSMIKKKGQVIGAGVDVVGSFANFLRGKYGDLDAVNRLYGTRWEGWEEVEPAMACANKKDFVALVDSNEYIEWYCKVYFEHVEGVCRECGIDVPFYVNSTGGPFPHNPAMLGDTICMTDLYFLGAMQTMLPFNAKLLKATQPITAAAEFRCGTFGQAMTESLYANQAMLWMAYGFHGVNYFMVVDRHRWANCPIDAVGRPGTPSTYSLFKRICRTYNAIDYPRFASGLVSDVNLLWWRPHAYTIKPDPTEPHSGGELFDKDTTLNHMYKALLYGNMQFELLYPGARFNSDKPVIIYAGHDFYDKRLAEGLLAHAIAGGTLIFYYNHPVKTVDGEAIDTFNGSLVPPRAIHRYSGSVLLQVGETDREAMPRLISTDTHCLADYDVSSLEGAVTIHHQHLNAGYVVPAGKGKIAVAGFDLTPDSIHAFMGHLGYTSPASTKARGVLCTLLRDKDEYLVGLVNLGKDPVENLHVEIDPAKLDMSRISSVQSAFQGAPVAKRQGGVTCRLPGGEGDIVILS
ncbi:MAG: beta-galactosidase [Candidatus Lokiarchaeota archaeon]|nr:beta-galactosidase [Candidatus Lokiarchaeota archaeon]